jgi:hypothetical protein
MSRTRLREAHIPILLWLPAAAMLHIGGGTGASEVAQTMAERASIRRFSREVRTQIVGAVTGQGRTTEVEIVDEAEPSPPEPELPSGEPPSEAAAEDPPVDPTTSEAPTEPEPPPPPESKPAPEPNKEKAEEPPPPESKPAPEKTPEPTPIAPNAPPTPPPPMAMPNGRIAVQNDPTLDPNQPDNPDAARIADQANRTEEETQAAHRSYDQNAPKPDGGGAPHSGPDPTPGNADEEQRGHSVEAKGEGAPKAGTKEGPVRDEPPVARSSLAPEERIGRAATPGTKAVAPVDSGKGERMPETVASERGGYTLDPDGGDGRPQAEGRAGRAGKKGLAALDGMILPGRMPTRFSVNAYGLRDALGAQQLRAEAEHARNTRLNKHRGTMKGLDFSRYRAAIENYVPHVKEGNQTSLNAARVPFASYINRMHNQIHPIFADGFLTSLDGHPDPRLADMKLVTHVEIILDGATGKLVRAGIVRPSGVTALEVAALRALEEASPYGKAPDVIVSPDGRVYVHWEFYRDPFFACTSQFAHPYLLKGTQPTDDAPTPVPMPTPPSPGVEGPKFGAP